MQNNDQKQPKRWRQSSWAIIIAAIILLIVVTLVRYLDTNRSQTTNNPSPSTTTKQDWTPNQ